MPAPTVIMKLGIMVILPFLLLGACAEPQATATIAAAPNPASSPAPTPNCQTPPSFQADKRNPATAWQRAVDGMRAEDCFQALDPQLAPIRREYVANPRQEAMDKKTLDLAPLGLSARAIQGGEFRHRLPMPD